MVHLTVETINSKYNVAAVRDLDAARKMMVEMNKDWKLINDDIGHLSFLLNQKEGATPGKKEKKSDPEKFSEEDTERLRKKLDNYPETKKLSDQINSKKEVLKALTVKRNELANKIKEFENAKKNTPANNTQNTNNQNNNQNSKKPSDLKSKAKGFFGFFKKKLTKESADDFKLEVYESWDQGLLTDTEKNFMINFINESVEAEQ